MQHKPSRSCLLRHRPGGRGGISTTKSMSPVTRNSWGAIRRIRSRSTWVGADLMVRPIVWPHGTMVWTTTGQVAIEKMHVGDLVLSQDPNTGELAYKPVLKTTIRPPSELVRLKIGQEEISTSGGHLLWVSGEGWKRSRHLEDGNPLHLIQGTKMITAKDKGGFAWTYNLVVADFHTYFIGKEQNPQSRQHNQ